jgi:iron complex outermembrane receptor protein
VALIHSGALPNSYARVFNVNTGATLGKVDYDGSDTTLLVSNDFALTPRLSLYSGLAWISQQRSNEIRNALPAGVGPKLDVSYDHLTPRFGARYDATDKIQLFANVSSVKEAPQIIGYTTSVNGAYTGFGDNGKLTYQSGLSFELGTRGSAGPFRWDLALYRSRIKDELLTVFTVLPSPAFPNGVTATTNARPTIHQGVEAFGEARLLKADGHQLSLSASYTLNDFHFSSRNLAEGRGRLPGLPKHVLQGALRYEHASGFYATGELDSVLTDYPIDYVNERFAPSYALLGLTVGYAPPNGRWRVFAQGQNLTDERYAAFTSATFRATAASAAYTPGVGRTVSAGVSYAF